MRPSRIEPWMGAVLSWSFRYVVLIVVTAALFGLAQPWLQPRAFDAVASADRAISDRQSRRDDPSDPHIWKSVRSGPNGHFIIRAMINGEPVRLLVDTGASHLTLSPADARRLGFERGRLEFHLQFSTANGIARAAPVRLRELRIDQRSLYDVDAVVMGAPLGISLLGVSVLAELGPYSVRGDTLELYW